MNILTGLAVGYRVLQALAVLKTGVQSARLQSEHTSKQRTELGALDKRTSDLESLTRQQQVLIVALQNSLKDALHVMEAMANRVRFIFWLALAGCLLGIIAFLALLLSARGS